MTLDGPPTRSLSPIIPNNARALRLTAAAGTELAGPFVGWSTPPTIRRDCFLTYYWSLHPERLLLHAASLRQACAHCGIFVAAATRRCPGSVSVPMSRVMLSHPLPVDALVSHYLTNKLIGHGPLPGR